MTTRTVRWVAAALLAGAAFFVGCGGGSEGEVPERVASWDEFGEKAGSEMGKRQVVFVGIDAGVWHFMDRLIDEGRLPNFARMKREGAAGPLMSVNTYVTPPAWTAMLTGYLPVRTGVYSFGYWDRQTREFVSANADDIEVPTVWDAASRAGLKTGVFNVPMTYPPRRVNGAVVTGQMTPIDMFNPPYAWPQFDLAPRYDRHFPLPQNSFAPPAAGVLLDSLNVYLSTIYDGTKDGVQRLDSVLVRVLPRDADPAGDIAPLSQGAGALGEYGPWLKVRYRLGDEVVEGYLRVKIAVEGNQALTELSPVVMPITAQFTEPPELQAELNERFGFYLPTKFLPKEVVATHTRDMVDYAHFFYDYDDWDLYCFVFTQTDNIQHVAGYSDASAEVYEEIDRFLGQIMERLPAGAVLMVASDHGSAEHKYGIDLNQLLENMRLLEFESPGSIDYDRTVVFHNLWHLYFNEDLLTREELAARGYEVPAGEDVRDWLEDHMRETKVRSEDGSTSFVITAEPLPRDGAGHVPDMVITAEYNEYMVAFWNIMNPSPAVVRELKGSERFWHSRDGVLLVWGDGVKAGFDTGPRDIQDVAPTILYLLGLPVAPDMDGVAITDLFEPSITDGHAIIVNDGYRDIPREAVLPDDKRESLQKKMRSLGYIQ